jgi:hypothetical protein
VGSMLETIWSYCRPKIVKPTVPVTWGEKPEGVVDEQFTPKKAVPLRVLLADPASVTLQALNARPFKSSHDRLNRFRLVGSWAF